MGTDSAIARNHQTFRVFVADTPSGLIAKPLRPRPTASDCWKFNRSRERVCNRACNYCSSNNSHIRYTYSYVPATNVWCQANSDSSRFPIANSRSRRFDFPHPHESTKSKNRRRFDVSGNSRRARSDAKRSRLDAFRSHLDAKRSRSVDFRSHSVDFRPVVSADVKSSASTQLTIWVRDTANQPEICDRKAAFRVAKTRKKPKKTDF